MKFDDEKAKQMPLQTVGILSMHKLGFAIREFMSVPTYTKHRAILKAHGFDIHDDVVMLEKKRGTKPHERKKASA